MGDRIDLLEAAVHRLERRLRWQQRVTETLDAAGAVVDRLPK
jgi:hypothetical protein